MSDDITPDGVLAEFWRWWKVWLTVLALIAALVVGMWRAGWWFAGQDVNRQARIIQNGYANQSALREQVTNGIASVQAVTTQIDATAGQQRADLTAQRLSEAQQVCYEASQISSAVPLPAPQASWVRANCSGGVVSPGSTLQKGNQ